MDRAPQNESTLFSGRFPATEEGLVLCQAQLDTLFKSPKPKIITDEIVSNIVRCSGAAFFSFDVRMNGTDVFLVVADDGTPFDPTRVAPPDVSAPVEERAVGGLGLFLVKKMSKSVAYEYFEGKNHLTVVFAA